MIKSFSSVDFWTFIKRAFWFSACVLVIPFCCFSVFSEIKPLPWWSLFPVVPFAIYFISAFPQQFRCWKIDRMPSAILYLYWALILMPIEVCFFLSYKQLDVSDGAVDFSLVVIIVGALFDLRIPVTRLGGFKRFSSEAVGRDKDEYGMNGSASNNAKHLVNSNKHVSVVALRADTGHGKSSFVRKMIESLDSKEVLYTYISFTETNDSQDFSRLFAERWSETLRERYPRLSDSFALNLDLLSAVLREQKEYSLLFAFMKQVKVADWSLFPTKAKVFDPFLWADPCEESQKVVDPKKVDEVVSSNVGKMFGGVPEIQEKAWVIVMDDFERSPIDEIYRAIEIIERFKIEGRTGLPVRVVFLLCFSDEKLKQLLDSKKGSDLAFLVDQFLISDVTKSVDKFINLPPIPSEVLKKHIVRRVNKFLV